MCIRYSYSMVARDLWMITTRARGQSPRVRVWLLTINPMATMLKYYLSYLIGLTSRAIHHGYHAVNIIHPT